MMHALNALHDLVWGAPGLILILGTGIYLTVITGFAQVRLFPEALRRFAGMFRGSKEKKNGISPFQALCTALAATVGTGNLVGVAGAICLGGPGAIFWMWVCGLLGMATKFAEATLAVRYRVRRGTEFVGGPMYMIRQGMEKRFYFLAGVYSFLGVIAAFGVGNATQINAVVTGINNVLTRFGGQASTRGNLLMGLVLAALVGAALLGGAKRIGQTAEKLVPFASACYIVLCAALLVLRADAVPGAFRAIILGAFSPPCRYRRRYRFRLPGAERGLLPGGIYQRSGDGNRVHCPRFRGGLPPGGTGAYGDHGGVSGHHRDLYHDGAGDPVQRRACSLRHGCGRRSDHRSFYFGFGRLGIHFPVNVSYLLRLCHGAGLGAVRRPVWGISPWSRRVERICRVPDRCCSAGCGYENRDRLAACRDRERPHGDSQPHCPAPAQPGTQASDKRIYTWRQNRQWRYLCKYPSMPIDANRPPCENSTRWRWPLKNGERKSTTSTSVSRILLRRPPILRPCGSLTAGPWPMTLPPETRG